MPVPFVAGLGAAVGLFAEARLWELCSAGLWDPAWIFLDGPARDDASSAASASELARPSPSESDIRENETVRAAARPDPVLCFFRLLSKVLGEFAPDSAFRFKADLSGGGGAMMALELGELCGTSWSAAGAGWRALCAGTI